MSHERLRGRLKSLTELSSAIFLRLIIYFILALIVQQYLQLGSLRYDYLVFSAFAIILIHEALHMIGLELCRVEHVESFHYLMTDFTVQNVGWARTIPSVILPFPILLLLGYMLATSGQAPFIIIGVVTITMHIILLPVEVISAVHYSKRM